jgi:predicted dehydrogenase
VLKTAIIGAGGISHSHVDAIGQMGNMTVTGVFDLDSGKAQAVAAKAGAEAYDRYEELLPLVDTVHILTPPSTHREYAIKALAKGKAVFCEKPMTVTIEDATAIVEAVERYGGLFMVGFNMRFRPAFLRLEEIVKGKDLGRILNFFCYRLGSGAGLGGEEYWPGWRTDPQFACGMTIESLSHDLDMLLALVGEVADVRANALGTREDLPDFDNHANVVMTLVNGGTALIHASWASYLPGSARGVLGLDGSVAIEGKDIWDFDILRLRTKKMEREVIERFDDKFDGKSYLAENRYFAECVEMGTKPRINEYNGLETVKISQAILRSHRQRIVVSLD